MSETRTNQVLGRGGVRRRCDGRMRRRLPAACRIFVAAAIAAASSVALPGLAAAQAVQAAFGAFIPVAVRGVDLRTLPPAGTAAPPTGTPTDTPLPATSTATPTDAPTPTGTPPPGPDLSTHHYDLHLEGVDVADTARMLEASHADLTAFFGVAPAGRLRGGVYATLDAMKTAMAADGETYPGGGGYFSPASRAFYLFVQPSDYFTRQLILHEATHQFHMLTVGVSPAGGWYIEGLAEHFGMHNWDGHRLVSGTVPAVSLEDYPATALAHFDAHGGDLASLIADGAGWDRPDGWGLVGFLVETRAPRFRDMFARLDRGEHPPSAWAEVFGPVTSETAAEYRAWLVGHQQPWREVWRAWQERGDVLEGRSDVVTLAVLKATPPRLVAELTPVSGPVAAGLVFGFQSADDFQLLQLRASRDVWVLRRSGGAWAFLGSARAEAIAGRDVLTAERDGDHVTLRVNGVAVGTYAAPGLLGLNVEGGNVHFRVTTKP